MKLSEMKVMVQSCIYYNTPGTRVGQGDHDRTLA